MVEQEYQERSFGDGKIDMFFLSDHLPEQIDKTLQIALSNGCNAPAHSIIKWAYTLYGDLEHADLGEAARQAQIEYTRQNYMFDQLVSMAANKTDTNLLTDLLLASHTVQKQAHTEEERVSQSYLEGYATGLATDEAYQIVEKISNLFYDSKTKKPINHMSTRRKNRVFNYLNVLEDQVKRSSSLVQLRDNFFDALKPKKKNIPRVTESESSGSQWQEVLKYASELGVVPTHIYRDGSAVELVDGNIPDLSHEHTGFIVTRVFDQRRHIDMKLKIITTHPSESFDERKRKLANEVRTATHLATIHTRIPSWLRKEIHTPEIVAVSQDANALMEKFVDGKVAGTIHEFKPHALGSFTLTELACYLNELQKNAQEFTSDAEFNGTHPSISDVFVKKYIPDSQNRLKKFIEYRASDIGRSIDLDGIIGLMTQLAEELPQYAQLFPDDEHGRTYTLAHSNLNPSSFLMMSDGSHTLVDWNRITLSNNCAFDASTVLTFLSTIPTDNHERMMEDNYISEQQSYLNAMLLFATDKQLFRDHLRVDLLYNRIPGELLHATNMLFRAIKSHESLETIEHYGIIINQLYSFLKDAYSRKGIFTKHTEE